LIECHFDVKLGRDDSFDYNVFDLPPDCFVVNAKLCHQIFQGGVAPFVTFTIVDLLYEDCVFLINTVVGKVHKSVFLASCPTLGWIIVLAGCEPSQTFLKHVKAKRVDTGDHAIDSEIELVAIQE
jgi:hypothetical protein